MSVFVHAQGVKTVHEWLGVGWDKKWQNSVHVVVECPLTQFSYINNSRINQGVGVLWNYCEKWNTWKKCTLYNLEVQMMLQ